MEEAANLTHTDLLASLSDIRLPATAPGGLWAELAVAVGLALILAAFLSLALPLITRIRADPAPRPLTARVEALRARPDAARIAGLLHLLRQHRPEAAADLSDRLYAPQDQPGPDELEALLIGGDDV